jgi:RNA-splicing ligase RtcB
VASREQTLKRAYKEAKADGKVTREELEKMALDLKDGAIEDAKRTLGEEIPELVKDIASSFDVEEYISSRIEAEVFNFKQSS